MKNIAFIDLDKTLIFSKRSIPKGFEGQLIHCYQRDNEPERGCWMPKPYLDMILDMKCETIIVTARELSDVKKLNLPFSPALIACNFGALIYQGDELIKNNLTEHDIDEMERFGLEISEIIKFPPTKSHKYGDKDIVWHYSNEDERASEIGHRVVKKLLESHFPTLTSQCNGRQFDVFPKSCLKEHAVKFILENHFKGDDIFTIGMGDSIIDYGFMSLCDIAITPTSSQLFKSLGEAN